MDTEDLMELRMRFGAWQHRGCARQGSSHEGSRAIREQNTGLIKNNFINLFAGTFLMSIFRKK